MAPSPPKRRRLSPSLDAAGDSSTLIPTTTAAAAASVETDLHRPIRRNAQCIAASPPPPSDRRVLQSSSAINLVQPIAPLRHNPAHNDDEKRTDELRSRSRCTLDDTTSIRPVPTVRSASPEEGPHECDEDDIEALTQRSILQELHLIQEENSQSLLLENDADGHSPGNEAVDAAQDTPAQSSPSLHSSPAASDANLALPSVAPIRGELALVHEPGDAPAEGKLEDATIEELGESQDEAKSKGQVEGGVDGQHKVESKVQALAQVEGEGLAEPAVEALPAMATLLVGEGQVEEPASTVHAPAKDATAAAETDLALEAPLDMADHSLLFEGLDADAFDDIELSPADPIKTSRPALGSMQSGRGGPPSSPLVARKRALHQDRSLAAAVESLQPAAAQDDATDWDDDGPDLDALFGSQPLGLEAPDAAASPSARPPPAAFMGFRTAANSKLAGPSEAAMKRARRLVFSQSDPPSSSSQPQPQPPPQPSEPSQRDPAPDLMAKGKGKGKQAMQDEEDWSDSEYVVKGEGGMDGFALGAGTTGALPGLGGGGFGGFSNAKGVALRPSEAALAAAKRLFAEIDSEAEGGLVTRTPPQAVERPRRIATRPSGADDGSAPPSQAQTPTLPAPRALPAPPEQAVDDRSMAQQIPAVGTAEATKEKAVAAPAAPATGSGSASAPAVPTLTAAEAVPRRAAATTDSASMTARTPTRPLPVPVQSHRRAGPSSALSMTNGGSPRFGGTSGGLGTPASQKRISLGMTPRGKQTPTSGGGGGGVARPKFRTPFKNSSSGPVPSAGSVSSPFRTPLGASRQANVVYPQPASASQRAKGLQHKRGTDAAGVAGPSSSSSSSSSVFDLARRQPRQSLAASGIVPEGVSPLQAIARGVPDEVLVILCDATQADRYAFDGPDGEPLGPHEALRTLLARGCPYADERWEHDSPPHLPMVLFVSRILESTDTDYDGGGSGGGAAVRREVTLELSDGWYRIRADLDVPLAEAATRGRIRVGQKLAIVGARLQSSGDGTEVLEALLTSSLSLSANSVSLARWDARLGFSRQRFFASLRSLLPEGGVVSAMDIVITKVFPLAYIDADSDAKSKAGQQGARGEAEEHEERDAWLQRYEETRARLEARFDQGDRRLEALMMALEVYCSGASAAPAPAPARTSSSGSTDSTLRHEDDAFSLFCTLEEADDPVAAFKRLAVEAGKLHLVPHLVQLVQSRLMAGGEESRYLLQHELEKLCPPRRVRDFRNPYARTVQLTVWDAAALGDRLRPGARFVVSNLVPTQKRSWRRPDEAADVFLSTRRDTRWTPVE
ncbi:uncharacterized protein PFL1_06597 [Pseudozyma flocculosa PF-1]|uniref:BRCA2 OB1 domain-containing protein n=1 Tax=Pseudozyma flocculosa PF-1 TaxID=1277687 RepID=A0A061H127_9BASI|nr:uncharacterized protein PFL1_06597 [Pseudozyma flocculosa PF-1]EPQ25923.1 hypothetical protein PFL1_06597 [Pseudozyma flocculosa PF-1]